jgi:FtsP/CotA-like multicopper oxidase with cupredoxin domain
VYDLGDTVPLSITVRDATGANANATTITLTITLPDGTTTSPAVTNPPASTGQYVYNYPTVQAGRHVWWASTTGPATAYGPDVFDVRDRATAPLFGLADAKDHLNIAAAITTYDDELRGFVHAVTSIVEKIVGPVSRRAVVETHSGGSRVIILRRTPIISVTSVTESGTTLTSGDWSLPNPSSGVLYRSAGSGSYATLSWARGHANIVPTYEAGRIIIPEAILEAGKELMRINWRPQQGGNYSPFDTEEPGRVELGLFVPRSIDRRLALYALPPSVA